WYDIDQFRFTNSGRVLLFEMKHGFNTMLEPRVQNMINKFANLMKAQTAVFQVNFSCESIVNGVCTGDMKFHGACNLVKPLNSLAVVFLQIERMFTKEEFVKFVLSIG